MNHTTNTARRKILFGLCVCNTTCFALVLLVTDQQRDPTGEQRGAQR